jgi:hypothetical protein
LVITTTIRAHSAIIPPAHTHSAARGKENIVTQYFELLIGHHHNQAHNHGISISTIIAPMAWPSRPPACMAGHNRRVVPPEQPDQVHTVPLDALKIAEEKIIILEFHMS